MPGKIRNAVKRLPAARSAVYLAIALKQMARDAWRDRTSFDHLFGTMPDPWRSTSESEIERFALTERMLLDVHKAKFSRAFEAGCAEGGFTERLAGNCDELIAADFSDVALDRARARLESLSNVRFLAWDARTDSMPGSFDLIVAMGMLTYVLRPRDVRRVSQKLIDALVPGGILLFSDTRQTAVFEQAWWGRYVLRGGEQIRRELARHPQLVCRSNAATPAHVFAVFEKSAENSS